ncbi:MAG: glycogen/starch/alpha-glucan phosphorylase [Thermoproteus sp.]
MIVSVTPELALDVGRNYAGGLGVLEGDKFYAAARLGVPYTVITLFYDKGYVSYREENGQLVPTGEVQTDFLKSLTPLGTCWIEARGEDVEIGLYAYRLNTATAVFVKPLRPDWALKAVERLYIESTDFERFVKYLILAKAAVCYVEKYVGWDKVKYFDLQEAYTALVPLVRPGANYRLIIHTPAPWGHPSFPNRFFKQEFGYDFAMNPVVLTEIGLAMAREGVVVSKKMLNFALMTFPHHASKIRAVTNAVEIPRWRHPALSEVNSPEELKAARAKAKADGLKALGVKTEKPVVVWARRLTRYKRPHFIAQLIEDLNTDLFYILGGRAHPNDDFGVKMMAEFKRLAATRPNVIYIPDLYVDKARYIIWAADIFTFTPFSGWEASGTSFMKAGINGIPPVASKDGAVEEVVRDRYNGWLFGEDRRQLLPLDSPDIDSKEYEEFKRKVEEALDALSDGSYWTVAYNAYRTFSEYYSMERLFRDYGYF